MPLTRKAYRAAILHSIADPAIVGIEASYEYFEDGLLVIDNGQISALGHASDLLPSLPADVDVFALALELSDRVYARSVHQHGQITSRMAEEGMRVFDAYVGLYLPAFLPKRVAAL